MPQEIIIDISDLKQYPKTKYNCFLINCWHAHESNPKEIEFLISSKNDSKEDFYSFGTFDLEIKPGKQVFVLNYDNIGDDNLIKNVKNIRYIKLIIKKNFGEDRTYINQVMLYENDFSEVKDFLKKSIENTTNNLIKNFNLENFEHLMSSKNEEITNYKNDKSLLSSHNSYNEWEKSKKTDKDKIDDADDESINNDKINFDINDNNDIKQENYIENKGIKNDKDIVKIPENKRVKKIEKILKQNILENNTEKKQRNEEDVKYKTMYNENYSNNNIYNNKNIFVNKKFPHTPNRFFIDKNNDINKNIIIKQRLYSPNINKFNIIDINKNNNPINEKKNKNRSIKKEELVNYSFKKKSISSNNIIASTDEEKDYDDILKKQLEDMENHINLFEKVINISNNINNKVNNSKYNNYDLKNYSESNYYDNNNFFTQSKKNKYLNNISDINNSKDKNFNRTTYTKYNKYSPILNNNKYSPTKINNSNSNNKIFFIEENSKYKSPSYRNKDEQLTNKSYSQENEIVNDNFPEYVLKDLASNNTLDINRRLDNLEKSVLEIKKQLSSIQSVISNLSSNNFNNLKEQIKQIIQDYLNEKINSDENIKFNNNNFRQNNNFNNNNNNNDNHSMYSEFMNDENKKFELEMNKKIEQKMEIWGEMIKNQIYNKLLKPSLNQIEDVMKQNIDEIKEKINDINNINNINNLENINRNNNSDERFDKKNKMLESLTNSELFSKGTAKLRNEKYEEINRLGEKLYQKLLEKEKKLKLLKQETSKLIEDNS